MSTTFGSMMADSIYVRQLSVYLPVRKEVSHLKEIKGLLQSSLALFAQDPHFALTEEVFHSVAILLGLDKIMDLVKSSGTTNQLVSFLGAKRSTQ
jgi:CRISPR/Cas system-associated protein endoribonuclease Cas2